VRKKILALAALPLALAFLGGCGGSGHSTPPPSQNVPVVVSISDTTPAAAEALPAGVNLISVQASVTGACLLTASDTGAAACPVGQSLLPAGASVQFSDLSNPTQLDTLSNTDVTANTYTALQLTFGSPLSATVSVDPGANFTDGTNSCPNPNAVGTPPIFCQLSPVVSTTTATVTFPSPIALTAGTPVSFIVGLDVTGSLVATGAAPATLSFNPIVSVTQGAVGADGNLIDVNNVSGTVSSISATSITLTDNATGLPLTLNIGSSTTVTNYSTMTATCATPNTIACVQVGDLVTLSYGASNTNPVQFTADNIAGNPGITSAGGFQGTIVETGATPEVVVTAVPAGNIIGISVGQVLGLGFTGTAVFSNSTGAALPAGSSFAAPGDLVVGQNVFIDACPLVAGVATCAFVPPVVGPPPMIGSVTADAIELLPGNVSGTFTAPAPPNFTVTGLNSFFTGNGVTSLTGITSASTTYSGTVSGGFSSLTVGNTYFYTGYLANSGTPATPNLLTTGIFGTE
jgi:hypothetical protein